MDDAITLRHFPGSVLSNHRRYGNRCPPGRPAPPDRTVRRHGPAARCSRGPRAVHDLPRYLDEVGFRWSPRILGIDGQSREIRTHLDGDSGGDDWTRGAAEEGLPAKARLLREYHAAAGFRPPAVGPGPGPAGSSAPSPVSASAGGTSPAHVERQDLPGLPTRIG
ncbi:MAG TPA: hypothetical protein VN408_11390 [Actinoplanes sp.]|nr:hypothetical protein [Actinoplanes sp.]